MTTKTMDPSAILFSLPTLCDAIFAVRADTTKAGLNVFDLHEDDVRQIEFVAAAHRDVVIDELARIEHVVANERTMQGAFRSLHVRKEPREPLAGATKGPLTLAALRAPFEPVTTFDALGYVGTPGTIAGGFAFSTSEGLVVYGTDATNAMFAKLDASVIDDAIVTAIALGSHRFLVGTERGRLVAFDVAPPC